MDKFIIHITYNENLCLAELNNIIDVINKSFNDINREYASCTRELKKLNPIVLGVNQGSIIFELLVKTLMNNIPILIGKIKNRFEKKKMVVDIDFKKTDNVGYEFHLHIEK